MPKPPRAARYSSARFFKLAAIGLVLGAALAILWRMRGPLPDGTELVRLKDLANAHLENGEFADADPLFTQLIEKLPGEPLAYRNQAICRLSALGELGEEAVAAGRTTARFTPEQLAAAVAQLLKQEPNAAATHVLLARTGVLFDERGLQPPKTFPTPLVAMLRATELDPQNVALWYELYELGQTTLYARDEAAQSVFHTAIAQAYHLDPRNLAVLRRYLVTMAQLQDPGLIPALRAAEETLRPLQDRVQQQAKSDLENLRQKAIATAEAGDWPAALGATRGLANLLAPQEAQKSDLRRVALFSLEYMRQNFEPSFYEKYAVVAPKLPETKVTFRPSPLQLPAELTEVADLKLADVDLDGRLDAVVLSRERLSIFRQAGEQKAPTWELLAEVAVPAGLTQILVGDLDRDAPKLPPAGAAEVTPRLKENIECEMAFPDFVLYGASGALVVHHQAGEAIGTRRLVVTEQSAGLEKVQGVLTSILVDFDHDGDLDLVARESERIAIWRNLGNLQFDDVSAYSQLPAGGGGITKLVAADIDHDLDIDIVCNGPDDGATAQYLENLRHGQFRTAQLENGFASLGASDEFLILEVDGNGTWDVVTARSSLLTRSGPASGWKLLEEIRIAEGSLGRLVPADFDNDGFTDVLSWSLNAGGPESVRLHRGLPGGRFAFWKGTSLEEVREKLNALDVGDLDGDGDLDLVYVSEGKFKLLTNDGGNANPWLQVRIAGRADSKDRVNASGIGSTIEVKTPSRFQAQIVTRQPTHFGLGAAKQADACRILFTNGVPQVRIQPPSNQQFCERMELLSSCPFLYTWNGERFEFNNDLLWNAPLGLQVKEGQIMPDRPWEYIKIDGGKCLPKAGQYTLQITAELWETEYFDEVKLFAIDHPAEVQIFTNEKVGPPDLAAHKIHTVRQPRRPVSAKNQRGRDLLPELAKRDGVYARPWDQAIRQGLVEEHFLELDLGELQDPQKIMLFLSGWIYPTDVSLNVALDQHPDLAFPQPPAIWTPDAQGEWQLVRPFMGFPSGKTKTIAVDVSDLFPTHDYRLRIALSQEICWDDVFFTVDEEPAEFRETLLELTAADLHYRGLSGDIEPGPSAPRIYDYSVIRTDPKWAPVRGKFTRYGDVRELLTAWDDKQIVMIGGDEITVSFRPPAGELPLGWKRDFVLYSVGWDKDAVLHTVYGQDSDPLPFKAMSRYPYGPDEAFPDTPEIRAYLKKYHTREQRPQAFWRQMQRQTRP